MINIRWHRSVLPFVSSFVSLLLIALVIDLVLYSVNLGYLKRWAGPIGVLLLVLSFAYSVRRKRLLVKGKLPHWLRLHEFLAWAGTLTLVVHAGLKVNAILPWIALFTLLLSTASGLTGTYILQRAKKKYQQSQRKMDPNNLAAIETHLIEGTLKIKALSGWRQRHIPITLAFFVTAMLHIGSILFLW